MTRITAIYDCQFIDCPWHLFATRMLDMNDFCFSRNLQCNAHSVRNACGGLIVFMSSVRILSIVTSIRLFKRNKKKWKKKHEINHSILLQIFIIINNNGNNVCPLQMHTPCSCSHSYTHTQTHTRNRSRYESIAINFIYSSLSNGKIIKFKLFTQIRIFIFFYFFFWCLAGRVVDSRSSSRSHANYYCPLNNTLI